MVLAAFTSAWQAKPQAVQRNRLGSRGTSDPRAFRPSTAGSCTRGLAMGSLTSAPRDARGTRVLRPVPPGQQRQLTACPGRPGVAWHARVPVVS